MIKKRKNFITAASLFIFACLMWFSFGKHYVPPMDIPNGVELPEDKAAEIIRVEQGYYNEHLPLFTRNIKILEYGEDRILYRVLYFPFGSIDRSYSKEPNGNWIFNLERTLTGIS